MKIPTRLGVCLTMCLGAWQAAQGEVLDTLAEYGNAATANAMSGNGTLRGFTNPAVGQYTLTAGGTDFWDVSDHGSFIYDADVTQAGDFSAVVRSISVADGEVLAGQWGRTGLMARKSGAAANSANVAHIRKSGGDPGGTDPADTLIQGRPSDSAGTDRGPNENGEFRNFAANTANGSVQNTPIWLGLHRFGGQYYATWAPDAGGAPGTWSAPIQRAGTPDLQGPVFVGLAHQSHDINPQVNTAIFDNFAVGAFNPATGDFPLTYTCNVSFVGNSAFLTASGAELGSVTPLDVNWEVRYVGPDVPTPGGLKADIYLQGNGGSLANFNTMTAGAPNGTTRIQRIDWAANDYIQTNPGGVNLFAQAVPGSFGADQENYGVHLTGEIFIPSDADRGGVEQVAFHDGVDDYSLLQINGATLIDDNSWTSRAGTGNVGGGQGILNVSDPIFDDGEWVSFRMGTWEGGGGDDAYLVWDALDRTGTDSVTGGTDSTLNTYTGAASGMVATISFTNHASDHVPPVNFRSLAPGVLATQSGFGQPANLPLDALPPGTKAIEVYLNGSLCKSVPVEPSIASSNFTAFDTATIVLADVGTGGTSDINPASLTVTRDGNPISPMITKTGTLTTIVDTFVPQPAPFTTYNYAISGNTTVATGGNAFVLNASARSFAFLGVIREGLGAPPNASVGWEVMEFTGAVLGGGAQGYRDAQNIIHDGTPAVTMMQPYVNHTDPETNAASGDFFPDLPILTNTGGDDNNYVTFARTTLTIPAGSEGTYTFRIRGDDGYGLRIKGATAISVAGSNINQVDTRDSTVFFPEFTGDSNAFGVFNFPTAGDYPVEFFGFEGGGGSFQEISWTAGAVTGIQQSSTWMLLGDTTGATFSSVWGTIPDSVIPALPTESPAGWSTHIWYTATNGAGEAVDNLDQTMRFLRNLDAGTSTSSSNFLGMVPELNHGDDAAAAGVFGGNVGFPGDPVVGDTDRIAMLAHALLVAPADGTYTIQIRSDDGFLFRFVDPSNQFTGLNGAGQLHPSALNEIAHPAGTGDSNTRASVFLTEGAHEVLFVWWEGAGGSHFEVSSAPGSVLTNGNDPAYALLSGTVSATNLYLGADLPPAFRITNATYDQVTRMISLTWLSQPGRIYGVYYSEDLIAPGFTADVNDSVLSQGATTTYTFPHPFGDPLPRQLYFRVQDNGASIP